MEPIDYQTMNQRQLESRVKILRTLCDQIDPYSPLHPKTKERLAELNIDCSDNPFGLTNQLLLLMEDALEELEHRRKKSIN